MKNKIRDQKWYPYAVAACIAVAFYVVLVHISYITAGIGTFLGYFKTVFLALILAYIINPLAKYLYKNLFGRIKKDKLGWIVSIAVALIIIFLILAFLLGTLIPQLADSVAMLVNNMDSYVVSLQKFTDSLGLTDTLRLDKLLSPSGELVSRLQKFVTENAGNIINAGAAAGKGIATWLIAAILSVYMLANKESLKEQVLRLMKAIFPDRELGSVLRFLSRCDSILIKYIVFSLIDSLIIGVINALFMTVVGMEYTGIVSMIAAVTNLIPTFGPIIGCLIGALILLLVKPVHALIFIIFSLVLQFLDGYIIKPKLFGNSLGVSGLLILVSVIVFGSMFGVAGMLLAIPAAAIIDFVYSEALLPWLESRAEKRDRPADAEA